MLASEFVIDGVCLVSSWGYLLLERLIEGVDEKP